MIVNETGCMGSLLVGVAMVLPGTMTGAAAYTCCRLEAAMSAVGLARPTESWAWTEFFFAIMAAAPFNCWRRRLSPFLPATRSSYKSGLVYASIS